MLAQEIPKTAPRGRIAEEYERLSQRAATQVEALLFNRLSSTGAADSSAQASHGDVRSVWVDSLRPEALMQIGLAAASAGKKLLFISPSLALLSQRQLRLGRRGPLLSLKEAVRASGQKAVVAWATPEEVESSLVSRAFGPDGPDAILIEDAHFASAKAAAFSPSFSRLGAVLKRWNQALLIASAPTSSSLIRAEVARLFERPELAEASSLLLESALLGEAPVRLRIEDPAEVSLAELISPLARPSLVLCATAAHADQVFAELEAEQLPVHRYHSALPDAERARQLLQFALPGRRAVMVAVSGFGPDSGFAGQTQADLPENFGPGYARQDIRSIVHLSAPCSLEQYSRELSLLAAERPARLSSAEATKDEESEHCDDESSISSVDETESCEENSSERSSPKNIAPWASSVAIMLFDPAQLALNQSILERKRPTAEGILALAQSMADGQAGSWRSEAELSGHGQSSLRDLRNCAQFLVDAGALERMVTRRSGNAASLGNEYSYRVSGDLRSLKQKSEDLAEALDEMRQLDVARLIEVEKFARSEECRLQTLHRLLGRTTVAGDVACARCDVCQPVEESSQATASVSQQPSKNSEQQLASPQDENNVRTLPSKRRSRRSPSRKSAPAQETTQGAQTSRRRRAAE